MRTRTIPLKFQCLILCEFIISFVLRSEYILKHDTVDDEENDTLTYTLKKTWIFKPELSNGLTGDENVTIIHPGINSVNHYFLTKRFISNGSIIARKMVQL